MVDYSYLPTDTIPLTVYRFGSMQEFMSAYKGALSEENKWTRYHAYNPVILSNDKKVFESQVPLEEQTEVDFIRMPQKLSEGFYLVDAVVNNEHKQAWFQVTSLAGFLAVSGSKTMLWLKDLNNGDDIAHGEVLFENVNIGKISSDGVAMFETPAQLIERKDESNDYYSYSPLSYFYTVTIDGRQLAIPIVFITGHGDIPMSVKGMKAGAIDFLPKPFTEKKLLNAIMYAISKNKIQIKELAEISKIKRRVKTLSPRELEVFQLVAKGMLNKQIAFKRGITLQTIKVHRSRVMQKMQAKTVTELIHFAQKADITSS